MTTQSTDKEEARGCCGVARGASEVPPTKVATGNSPAVKAILDDTAVEALFAHGYTPDNQAGNAKLVLMAAVCFIAMLAQFPPWPHPRHNASTDPTHRMRLGICCAIYFLLSTLFQMFVSFYEMDVIMVSKTQPLAEFTTAKLAAKKGQKGETKDAAVTVAAAGSGELFQVYVRSSFPQFQELYTLTLVAKLVSSPKSGAGTTKAVTHEVTLTKSIGEWFDEDGYFEDALYKKAVTTFLKQLEKGVFAALIPCMGKKES